jgi:hypothetical protein
MPPTNNTPDNVSEWLTAHFIAAYERDVDPNDVDANPVPRRSPPPGIWRDHAGAEHLLGWVEPPAQGRARQCEPVATADALLTVERQQIVVLAHDGVRDGAWDLPSPVATPHRGLAR